MCVRCEIIAERATGKPCPFPRTVIEIPEPSPAVSQLPDAMTPVGEMFSDALEAFRR